MTGPVPDDIAAVVDVAAGAVVKVILETSLLDADLILMRRTAGPQMGAKPSGGVKDLDTLLRMRSLGVTRFGTGATAHILDEAAR